MLTEKERKLLSEKIYRIAKQMIKESEDGEKGSKKINDIKQTVKKWLNSSQIKHSDLSYKLWTDPNMSDDAKRSEFSKKARGHDDDGKPYDFTDDEYTTLFRLRHDELSREMKNGGI